MWLERTIFISFLTPAAADERWQHVKTDQRDQGREKVGLLGSGAFTRPDDVRLDAKDHRTRWDMSGGARVREAEQQQRDASGAAAAVGGGGGGTAPRCTPGWVSSDRESVQGCKTRKNRSRLQEAGASFSRYIYFMILQLFFTSLSTICSHSGSHHELCQHCFSPSIFIEVHTVNKKLGFLFYLNSNNFIN